MSNSKNEIVFINQSSGYLMVDIINVHEDVFDRKILIAGELNLRNNKLVHTEFDKITKYRRSSAFKRILSWTAGFIQILWKLKTSYRSAHLFIVSNPPFSTLLPLFCNNSYSLLIYDIYPDVLSEYGVLKKSSILVKWWERINRKIYPRADKIFTISEGMKKRISNYVSEQRIKVIPIWSDNKFLKPIPKEKNVFVEENGLQDKFVVLYSGNLGRTHDLETLIYVAEQIKREDIIFLIIGEGDKKEKLKRMVAERALKNVKMFPWQKVEMIPYTFNSADIGVVTLGKEASNLSLPSKTFNYISAGVPLLCIADKKSELSEIVRRYEIGRSFTGDEVDEIIDFIMTNADKKNQYEKLRENVLKASKDFGVENAEKFVEHY